MGKPAARITDMHVCPMVTGTVPHVGGPVAMGSPNVLTGKLPQARVGDMAVCVGPPDVIAVGSSGVFVNKRPAARLGDQTAHGGVITVGLPTVLIGETKSGSGGGAAAAAGVALAFANFAAQVKVLIEAAASGAPFCEVCFQRALNKAAQAALKADRVEAPCQKPRQPGQKEEGAVPMTPALQKEIEAGDERKLGGPETAPGHPDLSAEDAATFRDKPKPEFLPPGTKLRRMVGQGGEPSGAFWVRAEEWPESEAEWRAGSAVKGHWNGGGGYVEYEAPEPGIHVWSGPARAQTSSDKIHALPGGAEQIVLDPADIQPGSLGPVTPTEW